MRKLWKGDVMSNVLKIRCTICEEVKDEENFHNEVRTSLGKRKTCKSCTNEASRQWRLNHPGWHLKKYNITLEDLEVKQKKLLDNLAPATVNLTIGMISTIYNHHIKRGRNITKAINAVIISKELFIIVLYKFMLLKRIINF